MANTLSIGALTSVAALGGLLFGYDTAVISGAIGALDATFIEPRALPESARLALSGWMISCALVGCVIGAALAGFVGDRFGRKRGLLLAALLFLISGFGSALPEMGFGPVGSLGADALTPFVVYRIVGGVGIGLASMLCPLYIAEISPEAIRGKLVSCNQLAVVVGVFGVFFVNYAIAKQGDAQWLESVGWRWMFACSALPAMAFLAFLLVVPESPRWLVMRHRDAQALSVLEKLLGGPAAAVCLRSIRESLVVENARLRDYGPRIMLTGICIAVFSQAVGINAVLYYAPVMFRNMGASTQSSLLQTTFVGAAITLSTFIAIFTVDRLGRRPLMIGGAIIMAVAMCVLGLLFQLERVGLTAFVVVIVYVAAFAFSWGPVTWVLLSEIFPNPIKGRAMAIAVAAVWIANFLVSWSFKVLDGNSLLIERFHHGFAYWLYGIMALLAGLFVWRYVPETKAVSLETMQNLWARPVRAAAHGEPALSGERP